MTGSVNPFEPWRPAGLDVPPPLHAARPWRPPAAKPACAAEEPPLVEPIADDLPPASRPTRRQAEAKAPSPPRARRPVTPKVAARPAPAPEMRADQKVVLGMVFVLGTLGLVGLGYLGGTHFPRLGIALLAVAVGFAAGISAARRRGWSVRLGWMAGGLAIAGLAGWFVPTTGGVTLWSAYRQVDELNALPAGDIAAYTGGAGQRKRLVAEFPSFAEDVAAAEKAWVRRSADAAIEEADRLLENDPHRALSGLQQLNDGLSRLEHYSLVQGELEAARKRARLACRKVARDEVEDLLGKKQFEAVARRGAFWADELAAEAKAAGEKAEVPEQLIAARRKAVAARLEASRREVADLMARDRFRAVADAGARLAADLDGEAQAVGMADDLDKLRTFCAAVGDLERQAHPR